MDRNEERELKHKLKLISWAVGVMAAFLLMKAPAAAASSSTASVDIKVSINASKSLSIGTTFYDFGLMNVNTSSVSASSILVTNDSGGLLETYTLTGANANSTSGGTNWTLASSTGPIDQYVLGAQFSNAAPTNTDAAWATSISSITVGVCSAAQFGNGVVAQSGLNVSPTAGSNTRNLWFRIITPVLVTDPSQRNATVTLAVQ